MAKLVRRLTLDQETLGSSPSTSASRKAKVLDRKVRDFLFVRMCTHLVGVGAARMDPSVRRGHRRCSNPGRLSRRSARRGYGDCHGTILGPQSAPK